MSHTAERVIRILFLVWGASMLLVGVTDLLAPRARYVGSQPEPGSTLAAVPTEIVVTFSNELHPDSAIRVVSTVSLLPSGEALYTGGEDVVAAAGLNPNDSSHRSLRAVLQPRLFDGLCRVDWSTMERRSRAERFGSFYFGVGMPVPAHLLGKTGRPFREDDASENEETSRRAALAGGVILIALGILLPRLRSYKLPESV